MHRRPFFIRLSVSYMMISPEPNVLGSWELAGRKRVTVTSFRDQKVNGQGDQAAQHWPKINHIFGTKAYELQTWYKDGVQQPSEPASPTKVKVARLLWVAVQVVTYRGGGILWWPRYRPHSLILLLLLVLTIVLFLLQSWSVRSVNFASHTRHSVYLTLIVRVTGRASGLFNTLTARDVLACLSPG